MESLLLAGGIIGTCALWAVAGFQVCKMTHRQRGIYVDDWNIVVPDTPKDLTGVSA